MISIKLFKVVAKVGNLSLFSGDTAVQSRPKSHTFTVKFAVFTSQMAVKNRGRVYFIQRCVTALPHVRNACLSFYDCTPVSLGVSHQVTLSSSSHVTVLQQHTLYSLS